MITFLVLLALVIVAVAIGGVFLHALFYIAAAAAAVWLVIVICESISRHLERRR